MNYFVSSFEGADFSSEIDSGCVLRSHPAFLALHVSSIKVVSFGASWSFKELLS